MNDRSATEPPMSQSEPAALYPGGRRRHARGPRRPHYLREEDHDRVLFTLVNVLGELSVLRDRLDTHEALAAQGVLPTAEAVEAFRVDDATDKHRSAQRAATLRRVFRLILDDYEERVTLKGDVAAARTLAALVPEMDP